jgi:hypothetical protein
MKVFAAMTVLLPQALAAVALGTFDGIIEGDKPKNGESTKSQLMMQTVEYRQLRGSPAWVQKIPSIRL